MRGEFTFCGTDIADLGVEYAPELEDTYVYRPSTAEIHEETFDGHHGGYFYGATIKPKEFRLRCFFEDNIDRGLMARVYSLFRIGRSGKLVFKRRPWIYYNVTVTEMDDKNLMSYRSGTFTVTMKAPYPFGLCDDFVKVRTDEDYFRLIENTALFEKEEMVPAMSFTGLTARTDIILANPGTERAPVCIAIKGDVGDGVDITNGTTGQVCRVVGITEDVTNGKTLYIDGMNGKTVLSGNGETELAFLYHDKGFIELEPAFPALRNIYCSEFGNMTAKVTNNIEEDVKDKYIFLGDQWRKITKQNGHELTLNKYISQGSGKSMIMLMNEISIIPDSNMNIDIEFIYKPTFM